MVQKSKQRMGSANGRWDGGTSSDFRRRIMKAVGGELIHHKDKNQNDNKKSNFVKLKPGKGITAIGKHNKLHREKGRK